LAKYAGSDTEISGARKEETNFPTYYAWAFADCIAIISFFFFFQQETQLLHFMNAIK